MTKNSITIPSDKYPDKLTDKELKEELNQFVKSKDKDLKMVILHDIIHLH